MKVLGLRNVEYTKKDTGEVVDGVEFHLLDEDTNLDEGHPVITQFINVNKIKDQIHEGDQVEFQYTHRGQNIYISGIMKRA